MKKFLLIFLCLLLLGMGQNSTGFHNQNRELLYKFDYTFQGEVSGVFLLVFRYRFFFYAHASVLLNARVTDQQTIDFQFRDIAEPGIILRSWGFRGKTFLTGVATYNQDKSNALLETDSDMLKKVHPDYLQFVKQWRRCPFVLEPKEKLNLAFSRKENGIHADSVIDMPVTRLCKDDKYYFNFNIYPMMRDLIDAYDHPFFNGEPEDLGKLETGTRWQSPPLNYSNVLNKIGSKATKTVAKHIKFKQKRPFSLTYQVTSKTEDRMTIKGSATPKVKIWGPIKIARFTRELIVKVPEGLPLKDSLETKLSKSRHIVGFAKCSLQLIDE